MDVETFGPNMMKRSESAPNRYVRPIKKLVFATFCSPYLCKISNSEDVGCVQIMKVLSFFFYNC